MRGVSASFLFALASFAATAAAALGQTATATPTPAASPSPSPVPGAMDPVAADFQLSLIVWLSTLALAAVCSLAYFAGRAAERSAPGAKKGRNDTAKPSPGSTPVTDKDLENSRISYGFWLIIAGFLIMLAVVIVSINHFRPGTGTTADVVAVVTAVTGVIGTLTTAFFGIQAAGAGRSQALSALSDQMKNGSSATGVTYNIDPLAGPHKGNTRVSITGNGFTGANAVNFGSLPGINTQVANDGLVYATSPELPFDPQTPGAVRSDVDVIVVFPGAAAQNKVVGKFYYYTVDVERAKDAQNGPVDTVTYINVYGSGLAGASQVQFGTYPPVAVAKASDIELQIPVRKNLSAEDAKKLTDQHVTVTSDQGGPVDPVYVNVWDKIWNQDVDVTIIYGADATASKSMPIGKYRIPQYQPVPTVPTNKPPVVPGTGTQIVTAADGSDAGDGGDASATS